MSRHYFLRFLLRLAAPLLVICVLPIGLIRLQPYNNAQAEGFFTPPEACDEPCFMGIRPGVTLIGEAAIILTQHGWTQDRLRDREVADFTELDTGQRYFSTANERIKLYVRKNVVQVIEIIETPVQLGDLWLLLGRPDVVYGFVDSRGRVIRNLVYSNAMFSIGYVLRSCSASLRELSQAQPEVMWSSIRLNTIQPIFEPSFYALRKCNQ
jgi:hypothetical protein